MEPTEPENQITQPEKLDPKYLIPDNQDQMMRLSAAYLQEMARRGQVNPRDTVALMMARAPLF
ncbi:MAG: hypothetical protein H6830_04485 [Planctomycetes bacterium]|nr:hypothetical protein [Planctomycetota bacterium]MCB9910493.1 hypothetical protein [Planctomycetota bacterium]MCB9912619.1 hypothetical protein [Planctomycetota bacterium]HRV80253.1 hypothetical protein [Planctomycetota bacterium]